MADLDFRKLGLKAGIEAHQQLDTGKLFCRCPSVLREEKADVSVRRRLRPVPSELGEYDAAALEAFRKGISYLYEAYDDTNCLIELDEEPPEPMDEEALGIALEVALLANAKVLDKIFVMRKAVIDGSNTSGFQRTALVASGGFVILPSGKKVGLLQLVLEEDAARPMARNAREITYRLDRLGIPLIELSTAPELNTPEEVSEAALALGSIFRSTGKVKRGLGTIRQDLNISIAGGARVEIKGVQKLEMIDEYVRREAQRQLGLLEISHELGKKGVKEGDLKNAAEDISGIFAGTESKLIAESLKKGSVVLAIKLKGFSGLLGREVQPGRRFGTEAADYVRARTNANGLLHSDELPGYGISEKEVEDAKRKLQLGKDDGFALVCSARENAEAAIRVIVERCRQAVKGVPEETRNALDDGNTQYSRPLPGAARMYPETDLGKVVVEKKLLDSVRKSLPLSPDERLRLYTKEFKMSSKLAEKMKLSNYAPFFEKIVKEDKVDATAAAALLLEGLVKLRRENVDIDALSNEMLRQALVALKEARITKESLLELLAGWSREKEKSIEEMLAGKGIGKVSEEEARKIIAGIVAKNRQLVEEKKEYAAKALMGEAMKELKGKVSGEKVSRILQEEVEKLI